MSGEAVTAPSGEQRICAQCGTALGVGDSNCPSCSTPYVPPGEAAAGAPAPAPTTPNGPVDLGVGETVLGQWKLEAKIGEGGMGNVFLATELKLGRKVAVKALSVSQLQDETVKRFEREAQVMGKLDHPNVVTLYAVGRHREIPFLVMRYLEGGSLWDLLDANGGRLTPEQLVPLVKQLCGALGYIHGKNLIHRDLKPSNIFVSPQGKVTLLDLGLARGHTTALTRTGIIWGTPDFMAPEQIIGEKQLDGRADLYALGVVLYRMISNQPPFPEADEQELMRAHLTRPRPDISKAWFGASHALALMLQKAMAIKPEDRFQTADEMATAFERVVGTREQPTRASTTIPPPTAGVTTNPMTPANPPEPAPPPAPAPPPPAPLPVVRAPVLTPMVPQSESAATIVARPASIKNPPPPAAEEDQDRTAAGAMTPEMMEVIAGAAEPAPKPAAAPPSPPPAVKPADPPLAPRPSAPRRTATEPALAPRRTGELPAFKPTTDIPRKSIGGAVARSEPPKKPELTKTEIRSSPNAAEGAKTETRASPNAEGAKTETRASLNAPEGAKTETRASPNADPPTMIPRKSIGAVPKVTQAVPDRAAVHGDGAQQKTAVERPMSQARANATTAPEGNRGVSSTVTDEEPDTGPKEVVEPDPTTGVGKPIQDDNWEDEPKTEIGLAPGLTADPPPEEEGTNLMAPLTESAPAPVVRQTRPSASNKTVRKEPTGKMAPPAAADEGDESPPWMHPYVLVTGGLLLLALGFLIGVLLR